MKFLKILLSISLGIFICCENKEKKYILNTYGDEIEITNELNSGTFELMDSTQNVKFINNTAAISVLEKRRILEANKSDTINQNKTKVEVEYDYSYYLDREIVDVFVIKNSIQGQKKFVRKLKGQLLLPIEGDSDLWER